ncbi:MAG: hypothetical protein ACKON7_12360, partial [Planctomycetaceae bacterium]
ARRRAAAAADRHQAAAHPVGGQVAHVAGHEHHAPPQARFDAGPLGPQPGLGMRRGTIVALGPAPVPPATFARGARWSPPLLALVLRRLDRAGFAPARAASGGPWRQWHGDPLAGGRGELFHPE